MTPDIPRFTWTREQIEANPYGAELEKQRLREEWQRQKKAEAEQRARAAKQGSLESYMRRRAQAWEETTGSEPPFEELNRWQQQYLDEQERTHQAERAAKLHAVEAEHYTF